MAAIVTDRQYREILSTSLAERSRGIEDLVSNENILFAALRRAGSVKSFDGPEIRQTVRFDKQDAQWYRGYDMLANQPIEYWNDARWFPKSVVVPVSLTGQEIRANQGRSQIRDVLTETLNAAQEDLVDAFEVAIYGDGTAFGGKALTGLAATIPTTTNFGIYGGIDRATVPMWQTTTYDANSDFAAIGTDIDSTTIRPMLNKIMAERSRGRRGADLLLASIEPYLAYDSATVAIQRITRENSLGAMGFRALEYIGAGKRAEIVLASGTGTSMPSNTVYGIDTSAMSIRYRRGYNFAALFDGDGQRPINQDAIAQFIGWEGELTLTNPLFTWKLYDSAP